MKNVLLVLGSYYALDKDYDDFRQGLNAKIIHLNLAFLFEDGVQLFIQYFYAEKYLDYLNNMSLTNATIMLIISMYSCFKCISLLRWARLNRKTNAKFYKSMIQPWGDYHIGFYTVSKQRMDFLFLVYYVLMGTSIFLLQFVRTFMVALEGFNNSLINNLQTTIFLKVFILLETLNSKWETDP